MTCRWQSAAGGARQPLCSLVGGGSLLFLHGRAQRRDVRGVDFYLIDPLNTKDPRRLFTAIEYDPAPNKEVT